jgi:cytoskeletal protein CcmA (bactofilin family)
MKNSAKILPIIGLLIGVSCLENCNHIDENVIKGSLSRNSYSTTDTTTIVQGSMTVTELKVKDLMVQGKAKIGPKTSLVDGDLTVQGPLDAKNLKVTGSTTIQGQANIENSQFNGVLDISGPAKIGTTVIEGDLLIQSKKLVIKSGLTVKGAVRFTNEPGVVSFEGPKENIRLEKNIKNGKMEETTPATDETPIHF